MTSRFGGDSRTGVVPQAGGSTPEARLAGVEVRTRFELASDGFANGKHGSKAPAGATKCPTSLGRGVAPDGAFGRVLVTGDQRCDQAPSKAESLLRAVADGRDDALALAAELARHVLDRKDVRLALEVLQLVELGSPHARHRAVELAELLLSVNSPPKAASR